MLCKMSYFVASLLAVASYGAEADQVRNLGYLVNAVGNASRIGYTRTLVMYRLGYAAEAPGIVKAVKEGTDLTRSLEHLRTGDWSIFVDQATAVAAAVA